MWGPGCPVATPVSGGGAVQGLSSPVASPVRKYQMRSDAALEPADSLKADLESNWPV